MHMHGTITNKVKTFKNQKIVHYYFPLSFFLLLLEPEFPWTVYARCRILFC